MSRKSRRKTKQKAQKKLKQAPEEKPNVGALTKLTPEMQEAILSLVRKGIPVTTAVGKCGISKGNVSNWRGYADEGKEPFLQFLHLLDEAEDFAEAMFAECLYEHATGLTEKKTKKIFKFGLLVEEVTEEKTTKSLDAAKTWLARRRSNNWAEKKQEEQKSGDVTIVMAFPRPGDILPPEEEKKTKRKEELMGLIADDDLEL